MKTASRFPMEYLVAVRPIREMPTQIAYLGKTQNLSQTGIGARFPVQRKFVTGERLGLVLSYSAEGSTTKPKTLSFLAQVIWMDGEGHCGLKILSANEETQRVYANLVSGFDFLVSANPFEIKVS